MKTYVDRFFSRDFLKNTDLQQVGVYYDVPIENIKKEKLGEFDYDDDTSYILLDANTIYNGDYVDDFDGVEYSYTDDIEIDDTFSYLMNKKYNKYLVVAFNCTWSGASGYSLKEDYIDCFVRNYDSTMYVTGSSKNGKYLKLRESHHDVPCGHTTIVVGLTDKEYKKLEDKDVDYIINYGKDCLNKVVELER
jgi:hypothetical protein